MLYFYSIWNYDKNFLISEDILILLCENMDLKLYLKNEPKSHSNPEFKTFYIHR